MSFKPRAIVAVRNKTRIQTIDLEMKSKTHNFVANGIVVGNSHSAAYAMVAARTLYLKVHFPMEFYCAFMGSIGKTKEDRERLRAFCGDAASHGVNVAGADINDSKVNFTISPNAKDPSGEVIRFGLMHIKKVGKQARVIVENQPYRSFGDFLKRGCHRKDAVANLVKAGAFDCFFHNRHALLEYYDLWIKASKKAVGPMRARRFFRGVGMPKDQIKEALEEFAQYSEKLATGMTDEDVVASENESDLEDNEDNSDTVEKMGQDIPLMDMDHEEMKSDDPPPPMPPKKVRVEVDDFLIYANRRYGDLVDEDMFEIGIEEAIGDIEVPELDESDVIDYIPAQRLEMAEEAYGVMTNFINPINHVTVPIRWIRNYDTPLHENKNVDDDDGIDIKSMGQTIGIKPIYLQKEIDGYVVKSESRKSQRGNRYQRVLIDDGYDRAWLTIFNHAWDGTGGGEFAHDEDGCRIQVGTSVKGDPTYLREGRTPLRDIIKEKRILRFKIKEGSKWGFTLAEFEEDVVTILPTTNDWASG